MLGRVTDLLAEPAEFGLQRLVTRLQAFKVVRALERKAEKRRREIDNVPPVANFLGAPRAGPEVLSWEGVAVLPVDMERQLRPMCGTRANTASSIRSLEILLSPP